MKQVNFLFLFKPCNKSRPPDSFMSALPKCDPKCQIWGIYWHFSCLLPALSLSLPVCPAWSLSNYMLNSSFLK